MARDPEDGWLRKKDVLSRPRSAEGPAQGSQAFAWRHEYHALVLARYTRSRQRWLIAQPPPYEAQPSCGGHRVVIRLPLGRVEHAGCAESLPIPYDVLHRSWPSSFPW